MAKKMAPAPEAEMAVEESEATAPKAVEKAKAPTKMSEKEMAKMAEYVGRLSNRALDGQLKGLVKGSEYGDLVLAEAKKRKEKTKE